MKVLKIPRVSYNYCSADDVSRLLTSLLRKRVRGKNGFSFYGAYKAMRTMPTCSPLGDYVILERCFDFFRKNNLPISLQEVRRSMMYFQPPISQWQRKVLAEGLFQTAVDGTHFGSRAQLKSEKG